MNTRLFCAVVAIGFFGTAAAHADSSWIGVNALAGPQTPGWFVTPGAEIGVQRLPRWNSTNSIQVPPLHAGGPISPGFKPQPRLFGGEYGGTLGYAIRDGALPAWLGRNVRIGITGTYVSMQDSQSASGTLGSSIAAIADLQGRVVILIGSTGLPISEALRVNRQGFDLNLRMASDIALAPRWTLTPSVAIFGGRTVDTYNFDSSIRVSTAPLFFFNQIDEKLRTWSLGGDFSAGLTWHATSALSFNLAARGGIVWQRSRLDGTGCAGFNTIGCPFAGSAFVPGVLSASSVSDSRSRIGFRGGASLNASLDMTFGILTVGGFFLYDSAVPGVENPALTALQPFGSNIGTTARIRFDDAFRYGGIVSLRIPLIGL